MYGNVINNGDSDQHCPPITSCSPHKRHMPQRQCKSTIQKQGQSDVTLKQKVFEPSWQTYQIL